MKTRRVVVVAGALAAALAAIVGAVTLARDRPQPVVHYQVELDVPPLEAALWFVDRYPQYFTSGEAGLDEWLDTLHERDREFVLAMGQTLTWAWVEHELRGFEQHEPEGLAREAIVAVRQKTLNQLELNIEDLGEVDDIEFLASNPDPYFSAGVFARLIRGASNCDGQNHLIALLLDTALNPTDSWLAPLHADLAGLREGHEIAVVTGPTLAQPIFVDGWSNLPAFTVDPSLPRAAPLLDEIGDPPAWVVPGVATRLPQPASDYAEAAPSAIVLLPPRNAPTKPVDLEVRAPTLSAAYLARVKDPWKLYLFARVLHIYDDPRANELYQLVLDRHCVDPWPRHRTHVCVASALYLKRGVELGL